MDRIEAMRIFARVVEQRSFSAAARDLSISRSTVSDAVQQLETRLSVRLLERTTKKVEPTVEGQSYYDGCVAALRAVDEADASVGQAETRGQVRVALPEGLLASVILPGLGALIDTHPNLSLSFVTDMAAAGGPADCGLVIAEQSGERLDGVVIGSLKRMTVASRSYLDVFGVPLSPSELDGHRLVSTISRRTGQPVPFEFEGSRLVRKTPAHQPLSATSATDLVRLAAAGHGIAQVLRGEAAGEIEAGSLVEILEDTPVPPVDVALVERSGTHKSPQARVFVDWLSEQLTSAE